MKKRTRFTKMWSKRPLPEDLWPEILCGLPVKSLVQLRCVSKSWRSLIDDPNFCSLHLSNFKNNIHQTHLFVYEYAVRCQNCVVRCSKTFRNKEKLDTLHSDNGCTKTLSKHLKEGESWDPVFSVDGLVMLRYDTPTLDLVLWNPSIRKSRALPISPAISKGTIELGFGFDSSIKDYKHVRLVPQGQTETSLYSIAVYTVGARSWKTIPFRDAKGVDWRWSFRAGFAWNNVCSRGVLYSLPKNTNSGIQELVLFDLSSEVFDSISLPPIDVRVIHKARLLVDSDGSVSWLNYSAAATCLWVLEGSGSESDSRYWTKRYDVDLWICRGGWHDYLYLKDGKLLLQWYGQVSSCNLETDEETALVTVRRQLQMGKVFEHVESLLLLNG